MFRFLLSVVAMLALTAAAASPLKGDENAVTESAVIQDTPHDVPFVAEGEIPTKADAQFGVLYAEGRITKLPQDQYKFYLTVMGAKNDKQYQEILSWFDSDPQLKNFKSQCHFNPISTDMEIYGKRYKATVPALPCIRVQQADGKTLFQASGKNVPISAEALGKGMSTECIFRWRRNRPNPDAEPAPNPDTDGDEADPEEDGAQPDINVNTTPKDDHKMTVFMVLAALAGGLAIGGGHAFVNNLQAYRANHH
jgi:hypothetical protein